MTMMSKLFSKTVKKTALWSVIIAIVLAAAIVVCALFGFNQNIAIKDRKTLTVSLNAYVYNTQLDDIKDELCGQLDAEQILEGSMSGDVSEIVFVFEKDADLAALKTTAETYFADKVANAEGWASAKYSVSASTEAATLALAKAFVLRAAIAGAVLAVLAFVYVSFRYNLAGGIATGVSVLLGMLLTAALVVLTRVPVTSAVAFVITLSGLLTAAMTLFTLNKLSVKKCFTNGLFIGKY
jgi:preprotein translocase subunit SecF